MIASHLPQGMQSHLLLKPLNLHPPNPVQRQALAIVLPISLLVAFLAFRETKSSYHAGKIVHRGQNFFRVERRVSLKHDAQLLQALSHSSYSGKNAITHRFNELIFIGELAHSICTAVG
jgi:hypothetical protein